MNNFNCVLHSNNQSETISKKLKDINVKSLSSRLVSAYWDSHFEINCKQQRIRTKQYGVNKYIYRQQDCIESIFLILQGSVSVLFHQKQLVLSQNNVFGDYEPSINIFRRITKAKTKISCKILQIPYEFFFNLRRAFQLRILPFLSFKTNFMKYCIKKLYKISKTRKNQIFLVKDGIGMILLGKFQLKKNLKVGNFRHRLQQGGYEFQIIKKHHSIGLLNQNQFFVEDICCNSEIGQICYWDSEAVLFLKHNFQQFDAFFTKNKDRQILHNQRIQQISKIYWSNDKLKTSILPYQTPKYYSPEKEENNNFSQQKSSEVKYFIRKRSLLLPRNKLRSLTKSLQSKFLNKNQLQNEQLIDKDNIIQFYRDQQIRKKRCSLDILKTPEVKKNNLSNRYFKKSINLYTQTPQVRKSELRIPQQFKQTKFKLKMFLKARKQFNSGFHACSSIKTFKNSIIIKKPTLKIRQQL